MLRMLNLPDVHVQTHFPGLNTVLTPAALCLFLLTAHGGHAERLPERPVFHQQRDPDSAAAVGQHECQTEEQTGRTQPPQPAGRRAGGARSHDLVGLI